MPAKEQQNASLGQEPVAESDSAIRILRQPSADELRPSERERRLLQDLFDWQERSGKTNWIPGQPLGS